MSFEVEHENLIRKRNSEAREPGIEAREANEDGFDPELKAAAVMERADFLAKEIKSGKKQMQNILIHITQVTNAIRQLRAQLQLAQDSDDPSSVKLDKEKAARLKKRIGEYKEELVKMRSDLIREQIEDLRRDSRAGAPLDELRARAEKEVDEMISEAVTDEKV